MVSGGYERQLKKKKMIIIIAFKLHVHNKKKGTIAELSSKKCCLCFCFFIDYEVIV